MRRLLFIIQKEFIQIFRNKAILPLMTVVPIVQLIVLSFAANNEVKDIQLAVVDQDRSVYSRQLLNKIRYSDRFILVDVPFSHEQSEQMLQSGEVDVALHIPPNFERNFLINKEENIQLLVNAINGQQATVGAAYLGEIIRTFNEEIAREAMPGVGVLPQQQVSRFEIRSSNWYNPQLNFKFFMVPGILGVLVTILSMLLTAMNVVREREVGTIEQINVTPIRKWQFILGKMVPFLLIGMFLMTFGLTLGKLIFDIPMVGSLGLVFGYCFLNLMGVLGLGLLISNLADTQQQAMFITFFFVIIFILMSGLFTPIESMPDWAQYLTLPNPIAHFVNVMRSVLLKGATFEDVIFNVRASVIMAVVFNALAVATYRKVV